MPIIPNREADLARPRERKGGDVIPVTKGELRPVRWTQPDPNWHKVARELYMAAKVSGQVDFYQQSDVALLWSLCDDLSHFKLSEKRSSMMAAVIYSSLGNLLITEGDRRKARIELHQPEPEEEPASVTAINGYKAALGLVPDPQ